MIMMFLMNGGRRGNTPAGGEVVLSLQGAHIGHKNTAVQQCNDTVTAKKNKKHCCCKCAEHCVQLFWQKII